jgi:hypothetical protein
LLPQVIPSGYFAVKSLGNEIKTVAVPVFPPEGTADLVKFDFTKAESLNSFFFN